MENKISWNSSIFGNLSFATNRHRSEEQKVNICPTGLGFVFASFVCYVARKLEKKRKRKRKEVNIHKPYYFEVLRFQPFVIEKLILLLS